MVQSVDVDLGTIDHPKPKVLIREGEKQVGAAEDHSLATLCLTQPPADGEENSSLRLSYAAGNCHLDIVIMHLCECISFGPDNLT